MIPEWFVDGLEEIIEHSPRLSPPMNHIDTRNCHYDTVRICNENPAPQSLIMALSRVPSRANRQTCSQYDIGRPFRKLKCGLMIDGPNHRNTFILLYFLSI